MAVILEVRRWYVAIELNADGKNVERTHTHTQSAATIDEARELYHSARRYRWVPIGAVDRGVEAIGFKVDEPSRTGLPIGPRDAIERLRAAGAASAAEAIERMLNRRTETPA